MTALTLKRIDAIIEALNSRLAGEIDFGDGAKNMPEIADYEKARDWAYEQRARRKPK